MSNTNRDYIVVNDVKSGQIAIKRTLKFYVTDKNTSNIFIKLVQNQVDENGIYQFTELEPANDYEVSLRIVKPDNSTKTVRAAKMKDKEIFQIDLPNDCIDIKGKYSCEILVSSTVDSIQELNTSDPFTYEVRNSILSNVGPVKPSDGITTTELVNIIDAVRMALAYKADRNEVFTMANMGQDIREAMTGGSVAVVGVNSVLEKNIARGQVTPLKTSFFKEGKNLFNKNTATIGYYVDFQTGNPSPDASYAISNYISVIPGTNYTMAADDTLRIAYYDAEKKFISGSKTGEQTISTPSNCYYVRYSFHKSNIDLQQFEVGENSTSYEPYVKPYFDTTNFKNGSINGAKLEDNSVTANKLTIIKRGTNLFDGKYTNYKLTGGTGALKLANGDSNCKTAIIEIKPNTKYSIIRQVPSRFNYGTATHKLEVGESLDGSVNVNRSGNGETASDPYVIITTGENDKYLYVNTTVNGKEILLQVVEGEQDKFTIKDYRLQLNNIDVYNRNEIDELLVDVINKNRFAKKGDICTITIQKAKFIFQRITDASINVDAWRLYKGFLVGNNGVEYTMWAGSDAEGAIQLVGEEDFVCGYHGDEIFETIDILIDGAPINMSSNYDTPFKDLTIVSKSRVYHCNTSASAGTQAFKRTKVLKFNSNKLVVSNRFECLEDLNINRAALSLFQCRKSQDGIAIINKFSNNNDLMLYDVPTTITDAMPEKSTNMTKATFYTNYGIIDFEITKGYDHPKYMGYISNFNDQNRLKVYFDYIKGVTSVKAGDILQSEFEINFK